MSETEMPSKNPLPSANSDEGEESKNKKSSTGYFKSFKPYDQRSCSDVLCLIILIFCFVIWLIILGVSARWESLKFYIVQQTTTETYVVAHN